MIRAALACVLLAGCGQDTLPLTVPVERTPARKTAIDFARRNPHMAVTRIRPDGRMFEVRDRESGRVLLLPEQEVRASLVTVVRCPAGTLLPEPVCLQIGSRTAAEHWETAEALAGVAKHLGGEPDSRYTAQFETRGWRIYAERRIGAVTRVFAVRQTFEK